MNTQTHTHRNTQKQGRADRHGDESGRDGGQTEGGVGVEEERGNTNDRGKQRQHEKIHTRAGAVGLITLPLQGLVRRRKRCAEATTTKT